MKLNRKDAKNAKKKLSALCAFALNILANVKFQLLFVLIAGQDINQSYCQQYNFKNYNVSHGLGSASINNIFQDSKGYIWFATQVGGVSRFNGKTFTGYTKADGLVNNDVTYVTEDKEGNLWFGTASGASKFNGTSFQNFNKQSGLTDGVVYAIYADTDHKIWFATQDAGIRIWNGTTFDSLTTSNGLSSNETYSVVQDKNGNFWLGLSNGIAKYSNGELTNYNQYPFIKDKVFFSALCDNRNNIWMGASSGELIKVAGNSIQQITLPAELQRDFIGGITQDKRGNIWLATDHGLLKFDGNKFKLFSEHEGFSVNVAQTVMCDYEGNIWAGTLGGGTYLFKGEMWVHYSEKEGLSAKNITAIQSAAANNTYYLGTNNGIFVFNPEATAPFKKINGIEEAITALSFDSKEFIWAGTQDGIYVLEISSSGFQIKKKYSSLAGEQVISPTKILHDSKGNTWIATYGSGLFCITNNTEKSYNTKTGFASDKILTIYEDSKSNIWVGTQDAGIIKYDGNKFSPFQNTAATSIWSIAEDKQGNIYWGSGESGLYRYDDKNITNYSSTTHHLGSDYITTLKWDSRINSLWAGSEKWLDKIQFSNDGKILSIKTYHEHDAMNHDVLSVDNNGALWIGTVNGLWLFNRNYETPNNTAPKIQLTGIRLFYENAAWKKFCDSIDVYTHLPVNLELPYNKNHLTFDIQALTTQDIQYTFILEGYDEKWSVPVENNEITYSNISPGDYVFKAKAINKDGIPSNETVAFSFTVYPPWYSTWWFRLAAVAIVLISLFTFIKTRERILKEQNIKLEKTVKERTTEIEKQKDVVEKTLVEKETLLHEKEILLKEIHHRVKNNLQTISSILMLQSAALKDEHAKRAIAESQSRVRSIALVHQKLYQTDGLEKVELGAFVKDLTVQVQSLYPSYTNRVAIQWAVPEIYILIDTAIPLGLIMNELLTNSFKYAFNLTESGTISITINDITEKTTSAIVQTLVMRKLKFIYRDSGPGFEPEIAKGNASSLGLRLINLLSQQIGAQLNYSNTNGSEYIFTFELHI